MRDTPWRLPYCPCERRPIASPASRSSLVSWSESNDSATAQRAPPGQLAGRSVRPARPRFTMPRQRSSGHCQGCMRLLYFDPAREIGDERGLLRHEFREFRRRHADAFEALRVELLLDLGIAERPQRLGVDAR